MVPASPSRCLNYVAEAGGLGLIWRPLRKDYVRRGIGLLTDAMAIRLFAPPLGVIFPAYVRRVGHRAPAIAVPIHPGKMPNSSSVMLFFNLSVEFAHFARLLTHFV